MATITKCDFTVSAAVTAANAAGAGININESFTNSNKNSSDVIVPNKVLLLADEAITSGNSLTVDLYDLGSLDLGGGLGVGDDNLGESHANSSVNSIMISNADDSAGTLRIDQTVTNSWTGLTGGSTSIDLPAGGVFLVSYGSAGEAVTDATDHLVTLTAVSGDVDATLVFVAN